MPAPITLVPAASSARHQKKFQPMITIAAGPRYDAYPNSWNDSSARNAPTRPAKLAGAAWAPVLKNQAGSLGS